MDVPSHLCHVPVGEGDCGEGEDVLQHDHDEVVVAPMLVRQHVLVVHATVVAVLHHDHLQVRRKHIQYAFNKVHGGNFVFTLLCSAELIGGD